MPYINKADAEALARKWKDGEVIPEDYNPAISEWKLEETVRALVKTGDLHQKQVVEEIQRRKDSGYFDAEPTHFVERFPMKEEW